MAPGSRRRVPGSAVLATVAAAVELAVVGLAGTGHLTPTTMPTDVPFLAIWVGYGVVAAVVLERRPRSQVGAVLAAIGAIPTIGVAVDHLGPAGSEAVGSALYVVLPVLVLVALPAVFPNGTGGTRARVTGLAVAAVLTLAGAAGLLTGYAWLATPVLLLSVVAGFVALVAHLRTSGRVTEPEQTQHRLFVAGFGAAVVVLAIGGIASATLGDDADTGQWLLLVGLWSIPVAVLLAMVLGGLWDTDLAVGRRAVQVGLMALAAAVVALAVATFGPGLVPSMTVSTGLLVGLAVALPVALWTWRLAGRWLYGVGAPVLPEHLDEGSHAELADLVAAAVRSPRAEIVAATTASDLGGWPSGALTLPLPSERLLVVHPRRQGESFTRGDRQAVERMAGRVRARLEREDLEHDLAAAHTALAEQRERAQRRMRETLHDEVGPLLVGAEMQARSLRDRTVEGEHARLVEGLHDALRQAREAMRTVLDEGSPRALADGLVPALERLAVRFTRPEVTVADHVHGPVDQATALAAYQVVAEALANVAQHAEATRCDVVVRADRDLVVTVIDDGRGIDPARPTGLGLASMRGRALELGGELSIDATDTGGTRVRLTVPLPEATA